MDICTATDIDVDTDTMETDLDLDTVLYMNFAKVCSATTLWSHFCRVLTVA
jgi:hypothetical protein